MSMLCNLWTDFQDWISHDWSDVTFYIVISILTILGLLALSTFVKGSYNKVLIIGGSKEYQGAPLIVAHAALRSGVGQVRMLIHQDNIINFVYPEVTYMEYNEQNFVEIINKEFKTIIFGNGSKVTPFYINLLKVILIYLYHLILILITERNLLID